MTDKKELRVVLDSVVAVSAFLTDDLTAELVSECQDCVTLYSEEEILNVIRNVLLEKPHIRNRYTYTIEEVEIFLNYLKDISIIVAKLPEVRAIERDPKDDIIIACAVTVSANYIVSRDRDLLDLGSYENIQIVPPEEFIHILRIEREHIENQNR